jgi:Fe-S cluster assembly iron-binding protein IscA
MHISAEAIQSLKQQLSPEDLQTKAIRFFSAQGCCGPSVQMALVEAVPATDESFSVEEVRFALEPAVKQQLEKVTLAVGPQGFKLEGFQSNSCC